MPAAPPLNWRPHRRVLYAPCLPQNPFFAGVFNVAESEPVAQFGDAVPHRTETWTKQKPCICRAFIGAPRFELGTSPTRIMGTATHGRDKIPANQQLCVEGRSATRGGHRHESGEFRHTNKLYDQTRRGMAVGTGSQLLEPPMRRLSLVSLCSTNHQRLALDVPKVDVDCRVQCRRDRGELADRQVGAARRARRIVSPISLAVRSERAVRGIRARGWSASYPLAHEQPLASGLRRRVIVVDDLGQKVGRAVGADEAACPLFRVVVPHTLLAVRVRSCASRS